MGLLSNDKLLNDIYKYLDNTDYANQEIGHRLAMQFLPINIANRIEQFRYSFKFHHKLGNFEFEEVSYGGIIVDLVLKLNAELSKEANIKFKDMYESVGLIEDGRCTKEMISNVIANGIAINPIVKSGNTKNGVNKTDNLQILLPEFNESTVSYFLDKIDNYKTI